MYNSEGLKVSYKEFRGIGHSEVQQVLRFCALGGLYF